MMAAPYLQRIAAVLIGVFLAGESAAQSWTVGHFAGVDSVSEYANGTGTAARFLFPRGIAADAAGNIFVADSGNHTIRKITPAGVVTLFAGFPQVSGSTEGTGTNARFSFPLSLVVDAAGNLYVGDSNRKVRKITPSGVVSTLAGSGSSGNVDALGAAASFGTVEGLAIGPSGDIFVADSGNHTIRKVTAAGAVTTLAGSPGLAGSADGVGAAARFNTPLGVAVDMAGAVYVADRGHTIRKVLPDGTVSTVAGLAGATGFVNGTGSAARFNGPSGIEIEASGDLLVSDFSSQVVRRVTPAGVVTTFAGAGGYGHRDGPGSTAYFRYPSDLAVLPSGDVFVADGDNMSIRRITTAAVVTTFAGFPGDRGIQAVGPLSSARFFRPGGVVADSTGDVFVTGYSSVVTKISGGVASLFAGQTNVCGSANGTGAAASFCFPSDIARNATSGDLFVTDASGATVRKITTAGVVTTVAGSPFASGTADGTGSAARFGTFMEGLDVDNAGNIYVADTTSHTIRKVTPAGVVTTIAGLAGSSGSADGLGAAARFNNPRDVAADSSGNVFVADAANCTIRKINPGGTVTTHAGAAGSCSATDGTGSAARFGNPYKLTIDSGGNLIVAEGFRLRMVTPAGVVTTLAGSGSTGYANGSGSAARFFWMSGIATLPSGALILTDRENDKIRIAQPVLTDLATITPLVQGLGSPAQLGVSPLTATTFNWAVLIAPTGSAAALSSTAVSNPTFTCDLPGLYRFALTASTASASRISTVDLTCIPSTLSVSDYTLFEGNSGSTNAAFTVNLSAPSPVSVSVMAATANGAALSGSDYTAVGLTLVTFAPGETSKTFNVPVTGDGTVEPGETFMVNLTSPSGATIADGQGIGAIRNDDGILTLGDSVTVGNFAGFNSSNEYADGVGTAARFLRPGYAAFDSAGNLFVSDWSNQTIRKITPAGVVTTFAGQPQVQGSVDGPAGSALFSSPRGLVFDASGNLFVGENFRIRKITPAGVVSTFAGGTSSGSADGVGTAARFGSIYGLTIDPGTAVLYATDQTNHTIRRITAAGVVTTLAGSPGVLGSADGAGTAARFRSPEGIVSDGSGNLSVSDTGNHTIRKVDPAGVVTTFAGLAGTSGSTNATGSSARFTSPRGLTLLAGDLYVAESSRIRKITPAAVATTLTGGSYGHRDGSSATARLRFPRGIVASPGSELLVVDDDSSAIRTVTLAGSVTTFAGFPADKAIHVNGSLAASRFDRPHGVAADLLGNVYVVDGTLTIRKISGGVVSLLAGQADTFGGTDGLASAAQFGNPSDLAVNLATGDVFVADNQTIRRVTPAGNVTTIAGSFGFSGSSDGLGSAARFSQGGQGGIDLDANGNVYLADRSNHTIRRITPQGLVTTIAGLAGTSGAADGVGSAARFTFPRDVAVDGQGNVYVFDGGCTIRRIAPGGVVTTLAGQAGACSFSSDVEFNDGLGTAARFSSPAAISVDASGNLMVLDNFWLRSVTAGGLVTTIAGDVFKQSGYSNGSGSRGSFFSADGLAFDPSGALLVADDLNDKVRIVTPGLPDAPFVGSPLAGIGTTNQLGVIFQSGASYTWSLLFAPPGSTATLSATNVANPTLTCDVAGVYIFELVATSSSGSAIRTISLTCAVPTVSVSATQVAEGNAGTSSAVVFVSRNIVGASASVDYATANLNATAGSDYTFASGTVNFASDERFKTVQIAINGDTSLEGTEAFSVTLSSPTGAQLSGTASSSVVTILDDDPKLNDLRLGTLAGRSTLGTTDGSAASARFNAPRSVALDGAGNLYIADRFNQTIRKVTPAGVTSTLAGLAGEAGFADGAGAAARFNSPLALALDNAGNVYVADNSNQAIRKVTPAGVVSTLAGLGQTAGYANGVGSAARFSGPAGIAFDASTDTLVVTEFDNHTIRRVTLAGAVSLIAGVPGQAGALDGPALSAILESPNGVTVSSSGDIYFSHFLCLIRRLSGGVVTTLVSAADCDGTASAGQPGIIQGMTLDLSGNLLFPDRGGHVIWRRTPGGALSILAGTLNTPGSVDGVGSAARFSGPTGLATDPGGDIFVADSTSNLIRRMTAGGAVTTVVNALPPGSVDGLGAFAGFSSPRGMARDAAGNLYVADSSDHVIRKITPSGLTTTLAGLVGVSGSTDGPGASARFNGPYDVEVVGGFLYVADRSNFTIRRIDLGTDMVSTLAGLALSSGSTDGTGGAARFRSPQGLGSDLAGNLYVADTSNHTVRKVTPGGVVTHLAGTALASGSSDGVGPAARFNSPRDVVVDPSGNVFVSDGGNFTLRMSTPGGTVTTVAGLALNTGFQDGVGPAARFNSPRGLARLPGGDLLLSDGSSAVRRVTPAGVVTTVAGNYTQSAADQAGYFARLAFPEGIAISPAGTVYIADATTKTIRATPSLRVDDVSLLEGNAGTTSAVFTVTLVPASSAVVTVTATAAAGTATSGVDFAAAGPTVLTFPPGVTTQTFGVTVNGDTAPEPSETFLVNLTAAAGATVDDAQGIGTITSDDTPSVSISDVTLAEGNSGTTNAVFNISLSASSVQTITVSASTSNLSAHAGSDYIGSGPTTITFAPGVTTQTFSVPIMGDTLAESTETFQVTLSTPTNATILDGIGIGTITNDDGAPPSRTFVSSTGSDANVCSTQTTPCRNLAAAIAQVAVDGEVIVLAPGEYESAPLLIGKGVKITSPSGTVAFIRQPITINAAAARVVLSGLTLKGVAPGNGVTLIAADTLSIEDSTLDGWTVGLRLTNAAAAQVVVSNSVLRASGSGISDLGGTPGNRISIGESRFEGNGAGIDAKAGAFLVRESTFVGNSGGGTLVGPGSLDIQRSEFSLNAVGVNASSSGTVRIGRSRVFGNTTGLIAGTGSTFVSTGQNVVRLNGTNATGTITTVPEQ